jgi:hypothetical protein
MTRRHIGETARKRRVPPQECRGYRRGNQGSSFCLGAGAQSSGRIRVRSHVTRGQGSSKIAWNRESLGAVCPPSWWLRPGALRSRQRTEKSRSDRRVSLKLQREAPQMPLSRGGDRCRDRGSRVARRNLGPRIERVHVTNARTIFSRGIHQFLNWTGPVSSPSKGRNSDLYRRCRRAIAGWALRGGIRSASVRDDTSS